MERLTIKTTKGAAMKMDDTYPDETTARADLMRRYHIAVERLAAYEDTNLEPEEITIKQPSCVFYCNRQCNLNGDFCAEGPGCPFELDCARARQFLLQITPSNSPLTLEDLRKIDEDAVWICDPDGSDGMWALVDLEYELCRTAKGGVAIFDTYSKTWLAYRRKPETAS